MMLADRNELITSAVDLVPWQARRFPRMPRGITTDDLESAGNEALVHAAMTWDPDHGTPWRTYARTCIKNAMRSVIAVARSRRQVALDIEAEDGSLLPRVDPKATDPADRAAAREMVDFSRTRAPRQHLSVCDGPDPAMVATKAAALRDAMFSAVSVEDAAEVVRKVTDKAKAGDLKAARLFFDLMAPGRTGTTVVHQQAVVIHQSDVV